MTTLTRQFTTPGGVDPDPSENLTTALWRHEKDNPNEPILSYRGGNGFIPVTYADMAERVRRLAAGFMALGLEPGTRICLFSPTRYEFTLLDYSIWAAGCATVTIYETSSAEQARWIITDSRAAVVVCADKALRGVLDEALDGVQDPPRIFTIDEGGLDELTRMGEAVSDEAVLDRAASVSQDDLATLVYTSGTTGMPKGCELTVRNFVWTVTQATEVLSNVIRRGASTLMFLPLAHSFARIVQVGSVARGAQIAFSSGIPNLMEELQIVRPTWLFSVPRVFEKVFNGASQKAHDDGKGRIFDLAAKVAGDYSRQAQDGRVSLKTRLLHGIFDRLVYSKLRDALGGRVEYAVSGGAGLGERLGHFFNGVGVTVLEGYGLTETSAGTCVNPPGAVRIGTVGQPVPGASAAIADDGEILLKGEMVFRGYWNNPQATAAAFDDAGWFQTGDIGTMDPDGYLSITGRKKEIIVTAGGKNVAPAVLEDRLRAHALVSQTMVVGDDRPYIAALVTIDAEEYPRWAERHEIDLPLEQALDHPTLVSSIQEAVDQANRAVSKAESIRRFRILPIDFSIEGDELTPTLKVKRRVVAERYAKVIQQLYD
ncbi:MAG TPA: long-chain fatty acid--CoA ligase [Acidimicrobiia bacterium]|nr:long-chain fatty acid--CoA ligase [Acidimicrobiia bacterium]